MPRNKILVAEDSAIQLKLITNILEKEGYEVCGKIDGVQVLEVVEEFNPDVILLDVQMPNMGGVETCKRLKEIPICRNTPVLFITAFKDNDLIVEAFKAGAIDYISKPFSRDEIIVRVRAQINYRELADEKLELIKELDKTMNDRVLGQISIGLAHNFNNMLTSVMGYCQIVEMTTKETDTKDRISRVKIVLDNMHRMVKDLSEFSGRAETYKKKFKVIDYLKDESFVLEKSSFPTLETKVISKFAEGEDKEIEIESFTTCLYNILNNSVENCLEGKSTVTIEVSKSLLPEKLKERLTGNNLDQEFIRFKFIDNGAGLSPKITFPHEIFQPFWTTKKTVGVGLGLSVVHGYVSRHSGYTDAYNSPEGGAVIEIYLPVSTN